MNRKKIDTILYNGTIYTLQKEGHTAEAIGIDKGRIAFVGSNKEAEDFDTENKIDLKGKTLLPGMGDSHLHMYAYCQNQTSVKLEDIKSIDELISVMKEKVIHTEKGKWIKGAGFDQTKFTENRLPTRWDLDKISMEHPFVIRRSCLHVMIANSLAIEIAGIDDKKIKYGSFKLFTDGSLGARSAALIEPYSDDPDNRGILVEKEDLIRDLQTSYELGLQPAIHAIGDRAMEITLDAIEYVIENAEFSHKSKKNNEKRLPFRIIHAQV